MISLFKKRNTIDTSGPLTEDKIPLSAEMLRREVIRLLSVEQLIDFQSACNVTINLRKKPELGDIYALDVWFLKKHEEINFDKRMLFTSLDNFSDMFLKPIAEILAPVTPKIGPLMAGDKIKIEGIGWRKIENAIDG